MSLETIRMIVLEPGSQRIFTCDGNGQNIRTLRDHVAKFPDGILIDHNTTELYGTRMGAINHADGSSFGFDGQIFRLSADGSQFTPLINHGETRTPKQITADFAAGKLYWCDREGLRVMRANLDGSGLETLVETGRLPEDEHDHSRWCVGIAVDPQARQFYWTQKGAPDAGEGRICRAGYDLPPGETPANRSDIEVLFRNLPEPIDLELDLESNRLWWTDRGDLEGGNSVCYAEIGDDRVVAKDHHVIVRNVGEAIGLIIYHDEGYIFSTSLDGELFRARLDGSERTRLGQFGNLTGIAKAGTEF